MHYPPHSGSFALDRNIPVIIPRGGREAYQETMGQRKRPSFIDFAQVGTSVWHFLAWLSLGCNPDSPTEGKVTIFNIFQKSSGC